MWPIQCAVTNIANAANKPFVAALYSGRNKPQNSDYLLDFVDELQTLTQSGIAGKNVSIKNIVCDTPARSLVKGTIRFNGRYGCDFCDVRGEYDGRMLFLSKGNLRTDESFRNKENSEHHKTDSPFLRLEIDMIRQFPLDPMHCVDLGVTKRLLLLWKEGPLPYRLSAGLIDVISQFHQRLQPCMPSEFNRKPRGLDELKMWKATELRTFLLYTGPVVLKFVLDNEKYEHFLSLSIAIRILYSDKFAHLQQYADGLLSFFVNKAKILYSRNFISYNVHCLLHLSDTAKHYGSLQVCSAYKYENNMTQIKKCVRGTGDPVIQIANRLAENSFIEQLSQNEDSTKLMVKSCVKLNSGDFCVVHEVRESRVFCEVFTQTRPMYTEPCDSRIIGIHRGCTQNTDMVWKDVTDFLDRTTAIKIPLSLFDREQTTSVVLIPLIHTL